MADNHISWFERLMNHCLDSIPAYPPESVHGALPDVKVDTLGAGGGYMALFFILLLLVSLLCFHFFLKTRLWKWLENHLVYPFVAVWLLGFVVYDVGMYTGDVASLYRNAPMAVLHAFEMFLFQSDVSAIHGPLHNSSWFMGFFSLSHFLAAFVSLVFVIKHFGFNIIQGIRRLVASYLPFKKQTLYVFWGMNDASHHLAESIIKAEKKAANTEDKTSLKGAATGSYRIIVVRTNHDEDSTDAKNGIERMFNFLSIKSHDLDRLEVLGRQSSHFYTTSTYKSLHQTEESEKKDPHSTDILKESLGLSSVVRFMKRTRDNIHIFCLSDDEQQNIQDTISLSTDQALRNWMSPSRQVRLYCHARFDSINSVLEDVSLHKDKIDVRVIDSSRLSVEWLRSDDSAQPVHFVKVEEDTSVSSPFNALVVGFGETGRDVTRFLYEFGAFVDHESSDAAVRRSAFHCHIVDCAMDSIKARFFKDDPEFDAGTLEFHKSNYLSDDFYKRVLSPQAKELNYAVLAVGDEEQNITLAVDVLRYVADHGNPLDRLCIYVRAYTQERVRYLTHIADHYNRLYGHEVIRIFGAPADIYTYESLIDDVYTRNAEEFYDAYRQTQTDEEPFMQEGSWRSRRALMQGQAALVVMPKSGSVLETVRTSPQQTFDSSLFHVGIYDRMVTEETLPPYYKLRKIKRKEQQDRSNSLHVDTKIFLLKAAFLRHGIAEPREQERILRLMVGLRREGRGADIRYVDAEGRLDESLLQYINKLMLNLSRLEHLRWNAAHHLLGYRLEPDTKKGTDDRSKRHICLVSWERLDDISAKVASEQTWEDIPMVPDFQLLTRLPIDLETADCIQPVNILVHYHPDFKAYDFSVVETSLRIYTRQ